MQVVAPIVPNSPLINNNPSSINPQKAIITVIVLAVLIVAANFVVFKVADSKGQLAGWKKMVQEQGNPDGKYIDSAPIIYELTGKIVEKRAKSLVLESNGQQQEFSTEFAQFIVVSELDQLEDWPTKIISPNDADKFFVGDQVVLAIHGNQLSNQFSTKSVIKIQNMSVGRKL